MKTQIFYSLIIGLFLGPSPTKFLPLANAAVVEDDPTTGRLLFQEVSSFSVTTTPDEAGGAEAVGGDADPSRAPREIAPIPSHERAPSPSPLVEACITIVGAVRDRRISFVAPSFPFSTAHPDTLHLRQAVSYHLYYRLDSVELYMLWDNRLLRPLGHSTTTRRALMWTTHIPLPISDEALEVGVRAGDPIAIHELIERLILLPRPDPAAEDQIIRRNNFLVARGDILALIRRDGLLRQGQYGFPQTEGKQRARETLEAGLRADQAWALEVKIKQLLKKKSRGARLRRQPSSVSRPSHHELELNGRLVETWNIKAMERHLGWFPLTCTVEESFPVWHTIEIGLGEGGEIQEWAQLKKIEGLLGGRYGYDFDPPEALRFAQTHHHYAFYYLMAVGYLFGVFGRERDVEAAIRIMRTYGVTF
jgi:hypothetical protein